MTKLALLAITLAACTTSDSTDIRTSGMYASIAATTTGDGTTDVSATLFVGNPIGLNYVELTGDDALVVIHASESKAMVERTVLNTVAHHAEFATDAEGAAFEVVFTRGSDTGAPSSIATLPPKFAITSSPDVASRASMMTVAWSPTSAEAMSWQATGDCIETANDVAVLDAGNFVIPANRIKQRMGSQIADTCPITVTVRRSRAGSLDPHYGQGGTVTGAQERSVTINSTP